LIHQLCAVYINFFSPVLQPSMSTKATSPLIASFGAKRKRRSPLTKRFKPPMAKKVSPMVTRSPMMRLLVSPLVVRPRSPSLSPWRSPSRSPRTSPACSPRSGATHSGSSCYIAAANKHQNCTMYLTEPCLHLLIIIKHAADSSTCPKDHRDDHQACSIYD
jgi:hypothetical protein